MMTVLRPVAFALAAALSSHAAALQLIDVPTGLAWSAEEVARAGTGAATILARTAAAGQSECRTHCEAIQRVWLRLADVMAGQQEGRAKPFVLTLHVVQADDVDAFAAPDGTLVLSEEFVRRRHLDDAQLAFVLAHEAAHTLLEHERQALTAALLLLPRNVPRTVKDIYVEFGFNIEVLRLLEPVMHQAEFEADEAGLQIAALAGYPAAAQLRFMENDAAAETAGAAIVSTHPSAASRLARLRGQLPLAERVYEYGIANRVQAP
jgi:Zn-dependent protease with chaperone function